MTPKGRNLLVGTIIVLSIALIAGLVIMSRTKLTPTGSYSAVASTAAGAPAGSFALTVTYASTSRKVASWIGKTAYLHLPSISGSKIIVRGPIKAASATSMTIDPVTLPSGFTTGAAVGPKDELFVL